MASRGETLESFLRKNNLGKYLTKFQEQGIFDIQKELYYDRELLTQNIGMTRLEANKFRLRIQTLKQDYSPVRSIQNELIDDAFRIQSRKGSLDIRYQLFTNLAPVKKRIGPFNTDQTMYCDLVNIICNVERSELGEDLTVELYTCEGYPLACRPTSYISKLSDWCLEEYPDAPLLYAVPRRKCYTDKLAKYMNVGPLCEGVDSIFIRNTEQGFDMTQIRTNCHQAMYFQLIKKIQDITGIPGHLIQLYENDNHIFSSHNSKLSEINIFKNQCMLELRISEFWPPSKGGNFCLNECKPTWFGEQSTYGSSLFFGCLYSLAEWMSEGSWRASDTQLKTLGHIRSITGCPPLVHALNLLFSRETLTLPHRVAIDECLILLFKMLKPKTPKLDLPKFGVITPERITEYSNYFWIYLIDSSTPRHIRTEQYSRFNLTCSETYHRMTNPVLVKDVNGVDHIVEQSTLNEKALARILYNYKRMIKCFNRDEAIVWNCITVPTSRIDLTREWKSLVDKCKSYPVLCVHAPLNVKSPKCPRPCMIPTANGNIGIYIDTTKSNDNIYVYFDITTGQSVNFDCQVLDQKVNLNSQPSHSILIPETGAQSITWNVQEIITMYLDTSESMKTSHFDGKTKYHAAFEAFGAFCDRIAYYDLKHVVGLILFTKGTTLEYPLSEKIEIKNENSLVGTDCSIYDAIKFGVDQLNNLITAHPECREVPRRILCFTDGTHRGSTLEALHVTEHLIKNKVTLDCVQFCDHKVDTHAIAKATGGYSFKPESSEQLLTIFEQEAMLSMNHRKNCASTLTPGEEIDLIAQVIKPFDIELNHILPEMINKKVQMAQRFLTHTSILKQLASHTNTELTKRILQVLSCYQANPHPAFEVFPGEENMKFWRIIMEGPDGTPYEGGIFELFIEFLDDYPARAPNIRFITPIYNCNINSSGRILHAILDRFYTPGIHVREIFDQVYGLLIDPEPDDPLGSVKAIQLRCHRDEYMQNARDYTQQHAKSRTKRQVRIDLLGSEQNVNVDYPVHLVCPLTLQLFEDPVITPDGETYEKKAIVEHLRNGKNYDPFSYRELNEYDLRPNKAVERAVAEFKQEIERAGQL